MLLLGENTGPEWDSVVTLYTVIHFVFVPIMRFCHRITCALGRFGESYDSIPVAVTNLRMANKPNGHKDQRSPYFHWRIPSITLPHCILFWFRQMQVHDRTTRYGILCMHRILQGTETFYHARQSIISHRVWFVLLSSSQTCTFRSFQFVEDVINAAAGDGLITLSRYGPVSADLREPIRWFSASYVYLDREDPVRCKTFSIELQDISVSKNRTRTSDFCLCARYFLQHDPSWYRCCPLCIVSSTPLSDIGGR